MIFEQSMVDLNRWFCGEPREARWRDHEVRLYGSQYEVWLYDGRTCNHRVAGPFDTLEAAKAACVLLESVNA